MTAAVIAPVLPTTRIPAARPAAARNKQPRRKLPLARLARARSQSTVYGLCALDRDGRVSDRAVIGVNLGWRPGTRVELREDCGLILASAKEGGKVKVTGQGHLHLPVSFRRYCGLAAGDRVPLAADPSVGLLVLYPPSVLDAMVTGFREFLMGGERP